MENIFASLRPKPDRGYRWMSSTQSLTKLPLIADPRGKLIFAESDRHVPFTIRRFFAIYDTPPGSSRGGHAHRTCHEFVLALSGSFTLDLDDGSRRWRQVLNDPSEGLYVPPMIWLVLRDFTPSTVCGVFASDLFEEADYIRNY